MQKPAATHERPDVPRIGEGKRGEEGYIGYLLRSGAIARRPHAVHGRIQHIDVTEAGKALLKQCRSRVKAIEQQILAGLNADEQSVIRRWLVSVAVEGGSSEAE